MAADPITKALVDALKANATLLANLAKYPEGGDPAVFAADSPGVSAVPRDARFPWCVVARVSDDEGVTGSKTRSGRDLLRDIAVYTDAETDTGSLVDELGEAVRALFHRSTSLAVPGFATLLEHVVSGPVVAPTDERVRGRIVTVRVVLTPP